MKPDIYYYDAKLGSAALLVYAALFLVVLLGAVSRPRDALKLCIIALSALLLVYFGNVVTGMICLPSAGHAISAMMHFRASMLLSWLQWWITIPALAVTVERLAKGRSWTAVGAAVCLLGALSTQMLSSMSGYLDASFINPAARVRFVTWHAVVLPILLGSLLTAALLLIRRQLKWLEASVVTKPSAVDVLLPVRPLEPRPPQPDDANPYRSPHE